MLAVVVAGVRSGCGKTSISIGLTRALRDAGFRVRPFKVGPDYIDPTYLEVAAGREAINLDVWMMGEGGVVDAFLRHTRGMDAAVVEGVMGMFDGHGEGSFEGSTAHVAALLGVPVVLVVDCSSLATTVVAVVRGFSEVASEVGCELVGVVLNRVASSRHERLLRAALERWVPDVEVVGVVPRLEDAVIPERHLGLVPADEREEAAERVASYWGEVVGECFDLEALEEVCSVGPEPRVEPVSPPEPPGVGARVAVVSGRVFTFYYRENMEFLSRACDVVHVDPERDSGLPDVDAVYVPGGYPEVYVESLNGRLMDELRAFAEEGGVVFGECGGLMYLCSRLVTEDGEFDLVGVFDADVVMTDRLVALGYVKGRTTSAHPWVDKGVEIRGHEFHYSMVKPRRRYDYAYVLDRGKGIEGGKDGLTVGNVVASYTHVHVRSVPEVFRGFVEGVFGLDGEGHGGRG
ncbi:MAG: hydrogenobyrinic acid a,c-diamide synthase (glutamine-hydrolyzing) [Methanopyri archaeon]|nr:hydrogenobyrinic acid a,c-diamide synthase (glutamine-hydrolyzing) [Methanopyri archaeon]